MKPEPNRRDENDEAFAQWLEQMGKCAAVSGRALVVPGPLEAVRPMPGGWLFSLVAAGPVALVSAVMIVALGTRGLRLMTDGQIAAFILVGFVVLGAAVRWFYQEAKPGSRVLVPGGWAMGAVGAGVGGFLWTGFAFHPDWPHFVTSGLVCLSIGTGSSIAAGWLLARVARMGYALDAQNASWAAGTVATLAGWIVLQIYCPKQEMAHLGTWHSAALVAGAATSAALTRRGFRLRA